MKHLLSKLRTWRLPSPKIQLNDEQQLALAILLVILVAISFLYCLGFASLVLRENWDKAPLPLNGAPPSSELYREGFTVPGVGSLSQAGKLWVTTGFPEYDLDFYKI